MSNKQPGHRKHTPQRTCVVCRQKFDKTALTRLIYTPAGLQVNSKGSGRGAYLCDNPGCKARAYKSNVLDRALRVSLSSDDKQLLLERP